MKRLVLSLAFAALTAGLMAQSPYQIVPRTSPGLPTAYPPINYPTLPSAGYPQQRTWAGALPPAMPQVDANRPLQFQGSGDIGTMIPLTLPGYELRVMDVTKKLTFDVNGTPVVAEVPLFIYMPRSTVSMQDSSRELRKLYNDLIMLYDQESVDKERVRSMLKRMDAIIDSFDAITPSVGRHTSAAY